MLIGDKTCFNTDVERDLARVQARVMERILTPTSLICCLNSKLEAPVHRSFAVYDH